MTGAFSASSAMITGNADLGGIFAVWDTPAIQAGHAAKTLGRDILVATVDLGEDSAVAVANGEIYAIGAQRPFLQGRAEAKAAAAALLGKAVPPYLSVCCIARDETQPPQRVEGGHARGAAGFGDYGPVTTSASRVSPIRGAVGGSFGTAPPFRCQ